jgi:hypothetical protein
MKTLVLLFAMLAVPWFSAHAQEPEAAEGTIITSAQVTGLDLARLSPGLQEEIGKLAGSALSRERLKQLASRIEAEQPRFVAAVRAIEDPDGEVRVNFVVARIRSDRDRENINARYTIERVEIRGYEERNLNQALLAEMHALVGQRLDSDAADRVETSLKQALPDYDVWRSIGRGGQAGQIRLTFVVRRSEASRWLHFEPVNSNVVYHSEQGWGSYLAFPFMMNDFLLAPIVAIDNGDDLIEEYGGFGLRLEARKIGTERLGASFEWTTFEQDWRAETLATLDLQAHVPRAYESRSTVTPRVTFAFSPRVRVSAGVSISELDPLAGGESLMANAAIGSLGYDETWQTASGASHRVDAAFTVRAGSETLESDLVYRRYVGQATYVFRMRRHRVFVAGMGGYISGDAPLFERFSLGNTQTLRGWDKYEIAPIGGQRMFHTSVEYRYRGFGFFLDSGSVWDEDLAKRVRFATGVTFHPGPVFFTVGVPLNTDHLTAVFAMGLRFTTVGIQKY